MTDKRTKAAPLSQMQRLEIRYAEKQRAKIAELEAELTRLQAIVDSYKDMMHCCSCDGLFNVAELLPATPCPESPPICHFCMQREDLHKIVDKLPKCWRLVDGELVQDCPVVPGENLYAIQPNLYPGVIHPCGFIDLTLEGDDGVPFGRVRTADGEEFLVSVDYAANSPEAAKALAERT